MVTKSNFSTLLDCLALRLWGNAKLRNAKKLTLNDVVYTSHWRQAKVQNNILKVILFATKNLMKLYTEQYSLSKWIGRWTTYIWILYSEQQVKGNWYAYFISKKHIPNRIKVFFLLFVQISGQRERRRKKRRGRDGINNGNWRIYLWVTGARDWVFQSQINWLNKCSIHTHRRVCIRPLVGSALQSHLRSFPMEEWINRY